MNTATITKGSRVRSIRNSFMTYRVQAIGPKRATLIAEGIGYFRCYCATHLLRAI